jgi:hypothetical protein
MSASAIGSTADPKGVRTVGDPFESAGATAVALALIEPTTYRSSHTAGADPDRPGREALGWTGRIRPKSPRLRTISRLGWPREAGTHPHNLRGRLGRNVKRPETPFKITIHGLLLREPWNSPSIAPPA